MIEGLTVRLKSVEELKKLPSFVSSESDTFLHFDNNTIVPAMFKMFRNGKTQEIASIYFTGEVYFEDGTSYTFYKEWLEVVGPDPLQLKLSKLKKESS